MTRLPSVTVRATLLFAATALLIGCGAKEEKAASAAAPVPVGTPITITQVRHGEVVVREHTVGRIEAETAPVVAAEVAGRVARVRVDVGDRVEAGQKLAALDTTDLKLAEDGARAEVGRLEALVANQARTARRYERLYRQKNVSEGSLEEVQSQFKALQEQLASAKSRLANARRNLAKATIRAPVAGRVQDRRIAVGDYVRLADPLFQVAADRKLRIYLPFPETVAEQLRAGQPVRLTASTAPDEVVTRTIDRLRPALTGGSRAVEAVVFADNPGGWAPGGSVSATVTIARHADALLVPHISVVRRPAGDVVYVLNPDHTVSARTVQTGITQGELIEIRSGLKGDERIAVDGAGFLSDGAKVQSRERS